MENTIFDGDKAALCTLKIDGSPDQKLIDTLSASPDNIQINLL
jgi:hypothetical protein